MRSFCNLFKFCVLQKSNGATAASTLDTAIGNGGRGNAVSCDETLAAECSTVQSDETTLVHQAHSPSTDCTEELDLDNSSCIPDTQLVQSTHHLTCLPATASSPDVEMIPDTPDNVSSIRVLKTFQRSYLASRSNLLAACDGHLQKKKTSPPRRKITKAKSRLHKNVSLSTITVQEYGDLSAAANASLVTDFSPTILQPVLTSHLPYPTCDILNKRCATDPFPLSKRSDHKVTPTKPLSLTSSDTVYGTVPSRLFQEALNREKQQQLSTPRRNKENLKPSESADEIGESSVLDSDPLLLEVLGELKVASPKNEGTPNVTVRSSTLATDNGVCADVTSYCSKTADIHLETLCGDDALEDILGELRQQNGIHYSLNDAEKNESSLCVNDIPDSLSLLSTVTLYSDSANIAVDRSLARSDESTTHSEAKGFTFADLKLEEQTDCTESCLQSVCSDAIGVTDVDGDSISCMIEDISDSKLESEMSFSPTCDQNSRYS